MLSKVQGKSTPGYGGKKGRKKKDEADKNTYDAWIETTIKTKTTYKFLRLLLGDSDTLYHLWYYTMAFLALWKIHFAVFMINDIIYK